MVKREAVLDLVYSAIESINEQKEEQDNLLLLKEDTLLYGRKSKLDSLSLVILIVDIEQRLTDELGFEVQLANEKAMSQTSSPFRDVSSLVDYICTLEEMQASGKQQ